MMSMADVGYLDNDVEYDDEDEEVNMWGER